MTGVRFADVFGQGLPQRGVVFRRPRTARRVVTAVDVLACYKSGKPPSSRNPVAGSAAEYARNRSPNFVARKA